jgi:hypothetical protein
MHAIHHSHVVLWGGTVEVTLVPLQQFCVELQAALVACNQGFSTPFSCTAWDAGTHAFVYV